MINNKVKEEYENIFSYVIIPALNVARLGNSNEYYVGSEIPGVCVGEGDHSFRFKDKQNRVKPQAARFRIYGCDENGKVLREIKLTDNIEGMTVEIVWIVALANKKAAHQCFSGIKHYNAKDRNRSMRNADWPHDRSTLEAYKKQSLSLSSKENKKTEKEFKARVFRHSIKDDDDSGVELYLGRMISEEEGSLLIIGGKGESGSIKENAFITHYADNDYWYDDTSDGFVDATVTITIDGKKKELNNSEGKSWVIVAPPKYAPGIPNLISLYQVILETQHPDYPNEKVEYFRDIRPIFEAICKNSWVNKMAFRGHGSGRPGNFLDPNLEKDLKNPKEDPEDPERMKKLRKSILFRVRKPANLSSIHEYNGQSYDYFMPPLSGNDGDATPTDPDTYLTVTRGQYLNLEKWANGDFEEGKEQQKYKYRYLFTQVDGKTNNYEDNNTDTPRVKDSRQPTYSIDGENYQNFQEIVTDVSQQIKFLNKAALEWCVGGAFFPGIEMTFLAYKKTTFHKKCDFRINSKIIQPGSISAFMALPWQADFNECNTNWWPGQRPDIAITDKKLEDLKSRNKKEIQLDDFEPWTRGFRTNESNEGSPKWGDMDMVRIWDRLGFIVEKEIDTCIKEDNTTKKIKAFVEVEHNDIYKLTKLDDIIKKERTINGLYKLLKIALQVEMNTIPPYLYAMYSIKPGAIGDRVRHKILHVAAEEMLHLSLVANLIVAIGHQPVFYSPKMIPFYPNPFPHFRQGKLMVHLSKANETTLNTFIEIERRAHEQIDEQNLGIKDDDIGIKDIGDLYKHIKKYFEELDKKGMTYNTHFQLEPGMGYAPSTRGKGLIIIKDLKTAKDAIDLIITQGEGCRVKTTEDATITQDECYEASHWEIFQECLNFIKVEEHRKYYHLWPVVDNQDVKLYTDPKIKTTAIAFNAAYSYLYV